MEATFKHLRAHVTHLENALETQIKENKKSQSQINASKKHIRVLQEDLNGALEKKTQRVAGQKQQMEGLQKNLMAKKWEVEILRNQLTEVALAGQSCRSCDDRKKRVADLEKQVERWKGIAEGSPGVVAKMQLKLGKMDEAIEEAESKVREATAECQRQAKASEEWRSAAMEVLRVCEGHTDLPDAQVAYSNEQLAIVRRVEEQCRRNTTVTPQQRRESTKLPEKGFPARKSQPNSGRKSSKLSGHGQSGRRSSAKLSASSKGKLPAASSAAEPSPTAKSTANADDTEPSATECDTDPSAPECDAEPSGTECDADPSTIESPSASNALLESQSPKVAWGGKPRRSSAQPVDPMAHQQGKPMERKSDKYGRTSIAFSPLHFAPRCTGGVSQMIRKVEEKHLAMVRYHMDVLQAEEQKHMAAMAAAASDAEERLAKQRLEAQDTLETFCTEFKQKENRYLDRICDLGGNAMEEMEKNLALAQKEAEETRLAISTYFDGTILRHQEEAKKIEYYEKENRVLKRALDPRPRSAAQLRSSFQAREAAARPQSAVGLSVSRSNTTPEQPAPVPASSGSAPRARPLDEEPRRVLALARGYDRRVAEQKEHYEKRISGIMANQEDQRLTWERTFTQAFAMILDKPKARKLAEHAMFCGALRREIDEMEMCDIEV